jgi:hypothetical protein
VLGETPMLGIIRQQVDDERAGALQRIRQIGVTSDQPQQPTRLTLSEHHGGNR